jgi:hypothetical protein
LNKILDDGEVSKVVEFHLYPKSFETDYVDEADLAGKKYNYSESYFYGIRVKNEELIKEKLDIENIIRQFCDLLEGTKPYI